MPKKTKQDPTGQAKNRNKGTRTLKTKLTRAEREIKALFRSIPRSVRSQTKIVNAKQTKIYDYDLNPQDQEQLANIIQFILNRELLESQSGTMPFDWYWKDDIELPYRQGTVEEIRDFNELVISAIAAGVLINGLPPQEIPASNVLLSPDYNDAVRAQQLASFSDIKGLSEKTSTQVLKRINSGIQAGVKPSIIANDIGKRFNVARSGAKQISETEINKAYNDSKLDATRLLGEATGLRAAVIHISALTPTTRDTHAARHGNAYTVADQMQWWNEGANRINCKCTTRSVLINRNGKVIDSELQQEIKEERAFFGDRPKPKPKPIQKPKSTDYTIKDIKNSTPDRPIKSLSKSKKSVIVEDQSITKTEKPPKYKTVKLTGDESAYVEYYKGDGFYKQNEILRNPSSFSLLEFESAAKMRDSINSAVRRSEFESGGTLFRGIRSKEVFANAEKLIGKEIPITTPQSTATNAGGAIGWSGLLRTKSGKFLSAEKEGSVVFKIKTRKGQHGLDLESLSMGNTGEREILLASGGNYKVTGVRELTDDDGKLTGKVIEVDYNE